MNISVTRNYPTSKNNEALSVSIYRGESLSVTLVLLDDNGNPIDATNLSIRLAVSSRYGYYKGVMGVGDNHGQVTFTFDASKLEPGKYLWDMMVISPIACPLVPISSLIVVRSTQP